MLNILIHKDDPTFKPDFYEVTNLPKSGFRSVYLHSNSIIDYYTENGTLEGYSNQDTVVGSYTLFVDFDDNDEGAMKLNKKLKSLGIGFAMYETGNRGYHFHIKRKYIESNNLPYSDKKFIEEFSPEADLSLYKHVGIFRITGTIHSKTGLPKKLVERVHGKEIKVPILEKENNVTIFGEADVDIFADDFIYRSTMGFSSGGRNNNLYKLIMRLKERGINNEFIEIFVRAVNYQCVPPIEEFRLEKLFRYHLK